MNCTNALRLGFESDRAYFIDPIERLQTWLPVINTLTVHPAMLFLLWEMSTMSMDLRIGYLLKESTLIAFDWIFNFALRIYGGIPYAALYCGGPLCRVIGSPAIHFLLSTVITTNVSCFLFLFTRMHHHAVAGSSSIIKLPLRTQVALCVLQNCLNVINIAGFTIFAQDSDNATALADDCELKWMGDRGGRLMIYGTFGNPQYFRSEVYILGVTLIFIAPIPVILTIDSVKKLAEYRRASMSAKTHQMTGKLLGTFLWQCGVAMVHIVFPLTILYTTMMIDYHKSVPEAAMTAMRVVPIIALITDPLHFSTIFILRTGGHKKISALLSQRFNRDKSRKVTTTEVMPLD